MNQNQHAGKGYFCPMHPQVRQTGAGTCPTCGMDLLPDGTRFGMLRHMIRNPKMLALMVVLMLVIMAAYMMMR
jgi:Heavy metal binding domain